jgi:hypothetical protein
MPSSCSERTLRSCVTMRLTLERDLPNNFSRLLVTRLLAVLYETWKTALLRTHTLLSREYIFNCGIRVKPEIAEISREASFKHLAAGRRTIMGARTATLRTPQHQFGR